MRVKRRAQAAASPRTERPAQRRRTRKAIVEAAIRLLARGTPSVADVAVAADVSRRTVYLYFPTFDQLLIDATLGALSQESVDKTIDRPVDHDDGEARLERMVRAVHHMSPEVERLGRTLIRLTVDAGGLRRGPPLPQRGYRRVEWIESALSPYRAELGARRWRKLVAALAMVVGWEALIVQRDVCGLSASDGEKLSVWAARALLRTALEEAAGT